jgi:hypothetical protein
VARFGLRIGADFLLSSAGVLLFMLGGDHLLQWTGAGTLIRSIGDCLLAIPVVGAGLWIAMKRMGGHEPSSGALPS